MACKHTWEAKFAPWCRKCHRTAMVVCSKCKDGRCYYHATKSGHAVLDAECEAQLSAPHPAKPQGER
jgi:hypothetical protein